MKYKIFLFVLTFVIAVNAIAQCAICTKTAAQIGEEAGRGFNAGILYLAAMPFGIMGYIIYRWRKSQ